MLRLHFSNRYEPLCERLVGQLAAPGGSPFDIDEVIIPSAAVRRQLTLAIARRHGICAQVRFSWLANWLWQQMAAVLPDVPAQSPLAVPLLTWRIVAALDDPAFVAAHPRLAAYVGAADPVMRLELAQRVAGLFDQYLTYRPEWLSAWGQGLPTGAAAQLDEAWQAVLWRRLVGELGITGDPPFPAFAQLLQRTDPIVRPLAQLPRAAHVFVLPTMPPAHLALLQQLGRFMDLQVYALNPCSAFWFDVVDARRLAVLAARGRAAHHEVGHRLLAAWGRQTQSHLGLLVDAAGDGVIDDETYEAPVGTSLLAQLQASLLELQEPAPGSLVLADDDRSLELHVCHSLIRELEVLHDRLLDLFGKPSPPAPGDILVVTADLEAAAPLIDAVFGTQPDARAIPYTISGLARSGVNSAARGLIELLALVQSRCPASRVFALLQQPLVARRFGLDDIALDQVHDWLREAAVHWALDAEHRQALDLPDSARHSFADGLDRLFLGYALPSSTAEPFDGLLPAGDAEGSRALALGGLWRFVDALTRLHRQAAAARPAGEWPALLAGVIDTFMQADDQTLDDIGELRQAIDAIATQFDAAGFDAPLTLDVVQAALVRQLDDPAHGGVPSGSVTFSSMSSLRGLPYRVVCVIGLDDGAFPSPERPTEFDLMAQQPRAGDRQRRLDERNLFLDLLLAARDHLHLSHAGRSVRDNSVQPPSVLVSELLDLLLPAIAADPADPASLAVARRRLVIEHPLQPFAESAFRADGDPRQRSFQSEYALALQRRATPVPVPLAIGADPAPDADDASEGDGEEADDAPDSGSTTPFFVSPLPAPGNEWRDVPLERLLEFFRQPCRFLLRQRLGIELRQPDEELQDDEAFVPELPARRALAERLLPLLLQGLPAPQVQAAAEAGTELPGGAYGRSLLAAELVRIDSFAGRWRELSAAPVRPPHTMDIRLEIDGLPWRVHTSLADLRPGGLVRQRYDDRRAGDVLTAWLHHLLLCADPPAGVAPVTTWLVRNGRFAFRPVADPRAVLATLLRLYDAGLRWPLYFFPKSAWAFVEQGESLTRAAAAWRATINRPFGEEADPAVRLALRGLADPLVDGLAAFEAHARAVFEPLLEHLDDSGIEDRP